MGFYQTPLHAKFRPGVQARPLLCRECSIPMLDPYARSLASFPGSLGRSPSSLGPSPSDSLASLGPSPSNSLAWLARRCRRSGAAAAERAPGAVERLRQRGPGPGRRLLRRRSHHGLRRRRRPRPACLTRRSLGGARAAGAATPPRERPGPIRGTLAPLRELVRGRGGGLGGRGVAAAGGARRSGAGRGVCVGLRGRVP